MKRVVVMCITAWFLWGCSPSSPSIVETIVSDSTPVTGQKVLLQILSVSDNYPMHYTWQADNGLLITGNDTNNYAYWMTPDTPGTYTVSCTVTDEKDQSETQIFTLVVLGRQLTTAYDEDPILTIEKQAESRMGGIWASSADGIILYITSLLSQPSTTWAGAFETIYVGVDELSYYTLWGAPASGNTITVQTTGSISNLTCESCEGINDLTLDSYDTSVLWVASDSGMYYYDSDTITWTDYSLGPEAYAFSSADYVYAATTNGVYALMDKTAPTLKYPGDSCEVLSIANGNDPATIWHITGGVVCKDGVVLVSQPAETSCSLDVDIDGNIWCGKYRWDGSDWWTPPDPNNLLSGQVIKKVVADTQGLVYFLTVSGALLRW